MKKIILNQKCYMSIEEITEFKNKFEKLKPVGYEFILFPPVLYLTMFKDAKYKVGTQNFFSYNFGSFTGEIALESLKPLGIKYDMVGHYERKLIIGETYSLAKEKMFKSLNSKFHTLLCVGEQKKTKNPFGYIKKELNYYLKDIESSNINYLSIIYEPSWAIGSGDIQCIDKISKTVEDIKKLIFKKYSIDVDVYYGGSIDEENIKEILEITDGVVLGKASTDIDVLKKIISKIN